MALTHSAMSVRARTDDGVDGRGGRVGNSNHGKSYRSRRLPTSQDASSFNLSAPPSVPRSLPACLGGADDELETLLPHHGHEIEEQDERCISRHRQN